ncbi:MAG: glycosyltransferase family 4 protein, partial [Anaerolineales bacterium]|nr:glycosyltransferase family 4 protein [Anaerolineales bacterium]
NIDTLIVHNIFTKHFNLPLTAALTRLVDEGIIQNCIAWCHDFTWTSPNSRVKVHDGYPWELLKQQHPQITYVVVSKERQQTLVTLYGCPDEAIHVVYNGVNPAEILGLSTESIQLSQRLQLFNADLLMLMPVRVTQAKNIEYALQVIYELRKHFNDPRLIITGPPDPHDPNNMAYYDALLDRRKSYDLESNVHFIYSSGKDSDIPYIINNTVVGDLYRIADLMFMPSHREGFGMPILEAGLAGIQVMTTAVPAAVELGSSEVEFCDIDAPAGKTAEAIVAWSEINRQFQFKRKIRKRFTWDIIFNNDIVPLLSS